MRAGAGKYKLRAGAAKYKFGAGAGKYKLKPKARAWAKAGGQRWGLENTNTQRKEKRKTNAKNAKTIFRY